MAHLSAHVSKTSGSPNNNRIGFTQLVYRADWHLRLFFLRIDGPHFFQDGL